MWGLGFRVLSVCLGLLWGLGFRDSFRVVLGFGGGGWDVRKLVGFRPLQCLPDLWILVLGVQGFQDLRFLGFRVLGLGFS